MRRYAEGTEVSVDRSRLQIEKLLADHGADQFVAGFDRDRGTASIMCRMQFEGHVRVLRWVVPMPDRAEFEATPKGRRRKGSAANSAWEAAYREQWRALHLVLKAKLVAVTQGVRTFDAEFLADIVAPDGKTIGEKLLPELAEAYRLGRPPKIPLLTG